MARRGATAGLTMSSDERIPVSLDVHVPLALSQIAINFTYLVASVLLIVGIRRLSSPPTARR